MPKPLLDTNLFVQPVRPNLVPRTRLFERLNNGLKGGSKETNEPGGLMPGIAGVPVGVVEAGE